MDSIVGASDVERAGHFRVGEQRYGFEAPQRDSALALVIDPGLEWSTYLGGSGAEALDAVALARDLGFSPQRHLVRMARGKELREKENVIHAIAGFELG